MGRGKLKRSGSKAHHRYERYKSAKTIQQLLDLGGTMADAHWDIKRGFIQLSPHQDEQAHEMFSKLSEDNDQRLATTPTQSSSKTKDFDHDDHHTIDRNGMEQLP